MFAYNLYEKKYSSKNQFRYYTIQYYVSNIVNFNNIRFFAFVVRFTLLKKVLTLGGCFIVLPFLTTILRVPLRPYLLLRRCSVVPRLSFQS